MPLPLPVQSSTACGKCMPASPGHDLLVLESPHEMVAEQQIPDQQMLPSILDAMCLKQSHSVLYTSKHVSRAEATYRRVSNKQKTLGSMTTPAQQQPCHSNNETNMGSLRQAGYILFASHGRGGCKPCSSDRLLVASAPTAGAACGAEVPGSAC